MVQNMNKEKSVFEAEGLWLLVSLAIAHCVVFYLVGHYQECLRYKYLSFGEYVPYAVGYSFALWPTHLVVRAFAARSWATFDKILRARTKAEGKTWEEPPPLPGFSGSIGMAERAAYVTAFIYGQHGFVAVWLAVKVAASRGNLRCPVLF